MILSIICTIISFLLFLSLFLFFKEVNEYGLIVAIVTMFFVNSFLVLLKDIIKYRNNGYNKCETTEYKVDTLYNNSEPTYIIYYK